MQAGASQLSVVGDSSLEAELAAIVHVGWQLLGLDGAGVVISDSTEALMEVPAHAGPRGATLKVQRSIYLSMQRWPSGLACTALHAPLHAGRRA